MEKLKPKYFFGFIFLYLLLKFTNRFFKTKIHSLFCTACFKINVIVPLNSYKVLGRVYFLNSKIKSVERVAEKTID